MSEAIPTSNERLYEETFEDLGHGLDPRQLARRAAIITIEHEPTPAEILRRNAMLEHFTKEYEALDPESTILKAHQLDAFGATYDFLTTPNPSDNGLTKRGLLPHAPGTGKSFYNAFLCHMLGVGKELVPGQPPIRGLYLSNDIKGVTQSMGNDKIPRGFAKATPWLDVEQLDVRGYRHRTQMPTAAVVGMTYQALVSRFRSHPKFFEGLDVIVADEAQYAMGKETRETLRAIMPGKLSFGLSGSAGKALRLFPEKIHHLGFREGIEERGILNSFVLMRFNTHQEIFGALQPDGDYKIQALRYARESEPLRKQIERIALTLASHNYSTIIYTFPGDRSDYARNLAQLLDGQKVLDAETELTRPLRAQAIGAFQPNEKNVQAYAEFDEKSIDMLVTTRMGEVAWDPADLNAILLVCPSASFDTVLQRLGRGARLSDKPTIVIHFEYDGPRQVTPYHIFGTEPRQGLMITNKDEAAEDEVEDNESEGSTGQRWIKKIIARNQEGPEEMLDGETVVVERDRSFEATMTPDHPEYGVFKKIITVLESAELSLGKQRVFLRNGHESVTFEEATTAAALADEYNLDERVLVQHFRRARHRFVSKDRADGGRDVFCDREATRQFIDNEIAKPNTYTTAQMAAMLGVHQSWVQNHLDQSEGEPRYPRDTISEQRAPYFPEEVFMRLLQQYEKNSLPIRDSEIPRVALARKYGVDLITVHKWFERQGIAPVTRTIPPKPGERADEAPRRGGKGLPTLCFPRKYEMEFAWAVAAKPLPKEGKHRTIAAAIEGSPVLRRMGHEQRIQLMRDANIQPRRYRRHTNTNYFISGDEYDALRELANRTPVIPAEVIAPSASATLVIRELDVQGFEQFKKSEKWAKAPIKEPVSQQKTEHEPLPIQNDQLIESVTPISQSERKQFLPLEPMSYRMKQRMATLVRVGTHMLGKDIFRRDPAGDIILIRETAAPTLVSLFRDPRNRGRQVPSSWPVLRDITDTFELDSDKILNWVKDHVTSQQLHIVYTGQQPVIFCPMELIPFLLRNFKKHPTDVRRRR